MTRYFRGLAVGVALVTLCAIAPYELRAGQKYTVYGPGTVTCGTWTADRGNSVGTNEKTWVLGFVSGVGYMAKFQLKGTDHNGIEQWITQYCASHPLTDLSDAASALVDELRVQ
jgi:hypothetical protein